MKCKNCGTEFEDGVFCPECGTKYIENEVSENTSNVEEAMKKAHDILDEYKKVEEEKEKLQAMKAAWPTDGEPQKRILVRLDILKRARYLNLETEYGKNELEKMVNEINADYKKIKYEYSESDTQIFWAVGLTIFSLVVLFRWGMIGKVIGVLLILGEWESVWEHKKDSKLIAELDNILEKEQIKQ